MVFTLKFVSVRVFNLAKYFLMTYIFGSLWDRAYDAALETRRYLSLWYTGTFSVSGWGRSRNNLFSGSNFQTLYSVLRNPQAPIHASPGEGHLRNGDPAQNGDLLENGHIRQNGHSQQNGHPQQNGYPQQNGHPRQSGHSLQNQRPEHNARSEHSAGSEHNGRPEHNGEPEQNEGRSKLKICGMIMDIAFFGLILLVVGAEAASELYTDSIEDVMYSFAIRNVPVRLKSSEVIFWPESNYSIESDLILARRCIQHPQDKTFVTRPNLVVERGDFYQSHGGIPTYNKSAICLYDETSTDSKVEVRHTVIETQRQASKLNRTERQTFSFDDVQHKVYAIRVLKSIAVPHFSNIRLSAREKNGNLFLADIAGSNYTCTRVNMWCVRVLGDYYEVIYPKYKHCPAPDNFVLAENATEFEGVMPFKISAATWPLLGEDRFMMRPARQGRMIEDIEDNVNILTIGYNFGWTTQRLEKKKVIVGRTTRIVPTVQVGYLIAIAVIVLCSAFVLILNALAVRSRKISGLVGEHAFVDRWHGHIEDDEDADIGNRRKLIIVRRDQDFGHLQPPPSVIENAVPLSSENLRHRRRQRRPT